MPLEQSRLPGMGISGCKVKLELFGFASELRCDEYTPQQVTQLSSTSMGQRSTWIGWMSEHAPIRFVARNLRRIGVHLVVVNTRSLSHSLLSPNLPNGISIRRATLDDCLLACRDPEMGLQDTFVYWAFEQGAMCHAAFEETNSGSNLNTRMVSYAWRTQHHAPHTSNIRVHIGATHSYGFKAFTLPAFRGLGIYPAIAVAECTTCAGEGVTTGISFTDLHNSASLQADRKFGNRILGLAGYIQVGSRVYTFHDAAVKRTEFRFVAVVPD